MRMLFFVTITIAVSLGVPTEIATQVAQANPRPRENPRLIPREPLRFRGEAVKALAFSPNGRLLAIGGASGEVCVLDLERQGEAVATFAVGSAIHEVVFVSDERLVTAATQTQLWSLRHAEALRDWPRAASSSYLTSPRLAVSLDRRFLALNTAPHRIEVVALGSGETVAAVAIAAKKLASASFSTDGKRLVLTAEFGEIQRWNWQEDSPLSNIKTFGRTTGALFLEGDELAIASWDSTLKIGQRVLSQPNSVDFVTCSADRKTLAAHLSSRGEVMVFDSAGQESTRLLHSTDVDDVVAAINADGSQIATGAEDGRVVLWRNGEPVAEYLGPSVTVRKLALSPNGRYLAAQTPSRVVCVDLRTGEQMNTELQGTPRMGSNPDEIVVGQDEKAWAFDGKTRTRRILAEPESPERAERESSCEVICQPGGRGLIAQTGHSYTLRIQYASALNAWTELARYEALRQTAWSDDGSQALVVTRRWQSCGNSPPMGTLLLLEAQDGEWTEVTDGLLTRPLAADFRVGTDTFLWSDTHGLKEARLDDGSLVRSIEAPVWWLGGLNETYALSHDRERLTLWDLARFQPIWHRIVDANGQLQPAPSTEPRKMKSGPFGRYPDWPQRIFHSQLSHDRKKLVIAGLRHVVVFDIQS